MIHLNDDDDHDDEMISYMIYYLYDDNDVIVHLDYNDDDVIPPRVGESLLPIHCSSTATPHHPSNI